MATTTTLVTVQEFLALPEPEDQRIELIGGEVVSMPRAGYPHETTKANLLQLLAVWLGQNHIGKVYAETAFQLDDNNCVIPDVSVIALSRIVPGTTGIFQGAPELAIEVVSSETADRLEQKIELYLSRTPRCPDSDDKGQYCYACYTGKYPTDLVHIEELVAAKGRQR